ncbi:MAG TPA: TIGR03667 family PPOX class F420-dependent oxidoreductase [Anaerolineales bacterium]|nr:TIGR03667 family PPOX class F420-dependent oxidoreductase [Anaerolineales bacterium]
MIDIPSELRPQVERRLSAEYFAWLTTVGKDLTPQPRPIWFVWDDGTFLIYSQPKAHKVRHIRQHPRVAVHFNADATGDNQILVFLGDARIDPDAPPAHQMPAYLEKYRDGIRGLNMTPEEMARDYAVAIRVSVTSVRGW